MAKNGIERLGPDMNQVLLHKRSLYSGLMSSMILLLLAKPLFNLILLHPAPAILPIESVIASPQPAKRIKQQTHSILKVVSRSKKKPAVPVVAMAAAPRSNVFSAEDPEVNLLSKLNLYKIRFSGKMTCDDAPCGGQVELLIDTDRNPDFHHMTDVAPDGMYTLEITLREMNQAQLDWRVAGHSGAFQTSEAQGRLILMDDANLEFDRPLNLHG